MKNKRQLKTSKVWSWLPTLYFTEGLPYILINTLSVIFYKRMGISNGDIALYTSWLYLPWVIKPLWSPIVDMLKTKRLWIIIMQLFIGVGLAGVAFTIPADKYFQYTMAFFWLLSFSSATHDIAADGFYMIALSQHDQAFFVGIRSTFYRIAMITGQGLLVILAGYLEANSGLPTVDINVNTTKNTHYETTFNPETIETKLDTNTIFFYSDAELTINNIKTDKTKTNEILQQIEDWNIKHNFYSPEKIIQSNENTDSWWKQYISTPLSNTLKETFSDNAINQTLTNTGNIGYTYFYLSQSPKANETIVLNFSYKKGDKDISLVKNYRFEFNSNNWNIPAFAAFQLDPKLKNTAHAVFEGRSGNITFAWTIVFAIISITFMLFFLYHKFMLPHPTGDVASISSKNNMFKEFLHAFVLFFKKKEIAIMLLVMLLYRLGESQLVKLATPFLLDSREMNGLGLTTSNIGLIYGTIGMISLTLGGIIGGIAASKKGLKYWIWWMALAMNLPNLVYVFLSYTMPSSLTVIGVSVAVEQFGYGFGFTAFMLYMIYISEGKHKTTHFAISTGFMALGMMLPGMLSGWLQEIIGYQNFFIWVMFCSIPIFIVIPFLKINSEFGVKEKKES